MAILCGSNTQVQQRAISTECISVLVLTAKSRKGHYQPLTGRQAHCVGWFGGRMLWEDLGSVGISICMLLWLWWDVVVIGGGAMGLFFHIPQTLLPADFTVCSPIASSPIPNDKSRSLSLRVLFDAKKVFCFIWWHLNKVTVAESEGILT